MPEPEKFEVIRPFNDNEVPGAIRRIVSETGFLKAVSFFFPDFSLDRIAEKLLEVKTIYEFQTKFVSRLINKIIDQSTNGITLSGLDNLDRNKSYLYISNHRDIVLDSAFLNELLYRNGFDTTEIAIGSNLLILPWITDMVKLNRTFIVRRDIQSKELYDYSLLLSEYIRSTITEKKTSIWIAQKEGRTKNGDDRTQSGLLKMLDMSGKGDFRDNFRELGLVPLTISYQYEPCYIEKVGELYTRMQDTNYKKTKLNDLLSMGKGMISPKGMIHFAFGKPLDSVLEEIGSIKNKNERYSVLAQTIDKEIHKAYILYPFNYVAAYILFNDSKYKEFYSEKDEKDFNDYLMAGISRLEGDKEIIRQMFLKIYANPVKNYYEAL